MAGDHGKLLAQGGLIKFIFDSEHSRHARTVRRSYMTFLVDK